MTWYSDWKAIVFVSDIKKKKFVDSNEVTPNNHLPSSTNIIAGLNEKVYKCLLILNSGVSCGFVFVCSINVSVCFFKVTFHYSFR